MALAMTGCSLLTSLDDLRGAPQGLMGDGGDARGEASPLTTCATPETSCVAAAPQGWIGPFELYDGPPSGRPSACPSALVDVLDGHVGVADPNAKCSQCACTVSGAITCDVEVSEYSTFDGSCSVGGNTVSLVEGCNYLGGEDVAFSGAYSVVPTSVTGGMPLAATPVWSSEQLGCREQDQALQRVDCATGEVCVPNPSLPFGANLCVMQVGKFACMAPYTEQHVYYTDFQDGRSCSACTCTGSAADCTGHVIGGNAGCGSGVDVTFGPCVSSTPYVDVAVTPPATSTAKTQTYGGVGAGAVTETQPVTVCCQ